MSGKNKVEAIAVPDDRGTAITHVPHMSPKAKKACIQNLRAEVKRVIACLQITIHTLRNQQPLTPKRYFSLRDEGAANIRATTLLFARVTANLIAIGPTALEEPSLRLSSTHLVQELGQVRALRQQLNVVYRATFGAEYGVMGIAR